MKDNPFSTKKFKGLRVSWYKKLKENGFIDIEEADRDTLQQWDCAYYQNRYTPDEFQAKQRYYELAGRLLHIENEFWTDKEKSIWRLHSEGLTIREIAVIVEVKVWEVHRVLKRCGALVRFMNR